MNFAKKKKTKLTKLFVTIIVGLVLTYLLCNYLLEGFYRPIDINDQTEITVIIPENSAARNIAQLLKEKGLIRNEKIFLFYCQQNDKDKALRSGAYILSRSQNMHEIVEIIVSGAVQQLRFTIPEGYSVKQIGALLESKQICSNDEWQKAITKDYDYYFLKNLADKTNNLEGFLFPDTYYVTAEVTAEQIIIMLLENFWSVWNNTSAQTVGQDIDIIHKTVTIASLIEKEARVVEERSRIAGVIYNRLKINMPLQIDATILFSMGEHKSKVIYKDLEVDSPYNTYKYGGLPPGPITCPGKASLEAALGPEKHEYLYYVSKGDGSHYFSKTYSEHLEAIKRFNP